ncbi:MAG: M56 family metallopeptidase [Candidatus Bathyarchaeia archaeon]
MLQPNILLQMKQEIYANTIALGKPIDCDTAGQVLGKYGFYCRPEDVSAKSLDVYGIVRRVAERFRMAMPTVVVMNTMVPNAAAAGPSPSRGVILITTGLLVQLEEPEVESVVGHEFGHLRGRDPLIIFALTAGEYLFRFYVIFGLAPWLFFSVFGYLYFIGAMGLIFFIAKFFEARADLVSAMVVGQPQVLAQALRKIGFRRLQMERVPSYKVQAWTGFDPHPPIYFRVDRLEKLSSLEQVRHPLLQSVRDVVRGFLASI